MGLVEPISATHLLTALNILVEIFGVIIVVVTIYEYTKLEGLRKDFQNFYTEWRNELHKSEKAMQRVIASYSLNRSG